VAIQNKNLFLKKVAAKSTEEYQSLAAVVKWLELSKTPTLETWFVCDPVFSLSSRLLTSSSSFSQRSTGFRLLLHGL
jgi:hypothetical protein